MEQEEKGEYYTNVAGFRVSREVAVGTIVGMMVIGYNLISDWVIAKENQKSFRSAIEEIREELTKRSDSYDEIHEQLRAEMVLYNRETNARINRLVEIELQSRRQKEAK